MKKNNELSLEVGDLVVYPIYGVGEIENLILIMLMVHSKISYNKFWQDKMKLRSLKIRLQILIEKVKCKNDYLNIRGFGRKTV